MAHNIKPGVAVGDQVQEIFNYAKEKGFALPAVNVIGSDTINGVLETARDLNAPVIIPFSLCPYPKPKLPGKTFFSLCTILMFSMLEISINTWNNEQDI